MKAHVLPPRPTQLGLKVRPQCECGLTSPDDAFPHVRERDGRTIQLDRFHKRRPNADACHGSRVATAAKLRFELT